METPLRVLGNRGEDLAADFLRRRGFKIVARQVHIGRLGEIDLICKRWGLLVFVEVKARTTAAYGTPEEAVTSWKRERLRRAIFGYLARHSLADVNYRVDVVAIDWSGAEPTIRHHESVEL
jgi:putative endonuclease